MHHWKYKKGHKITDTHVRVFEKPHLFQIAEADSKECESAMG